MGYKGIHTGETIDNEISRVKDGSVVTDNTVTSIQYNQDKPISSKGVAVKFNLFKVCAGDEPFTLKMLPYMESQNIETFSYMLKNMQYNIEEYPVYLYIKGDNTDWLNHRNYTLLSSSVNVYQQGYYVYNFSLEVYPQLENHISIMNIALTCRKYSEEVWELVARPKIINYPIGSKNEEESEEEKAKKEEMAYWRDFYSTELSNIDRYNHGVELRWAHLINKEAQYYTDYLQAKVTYEDRCTKLKSLKTSYELFMIALNEVKTKGEVYYNARANLEREVDKIQETRNIIQLLKEEYTSLYNKVNDEYEGYKASLGFRGLRAFPQKNISNEHKETAGKKYSDAASALLTALDIILDTEPFNPTEEEIENITELRSKYAFAKAIFDSASNQFLLDLYSSTAQDWPERLLGPYYLNDDITIDYGSIENFLKEFKKKSLIIKNSNKTSRYFYSIASSKLQLESFKNFIEEEIAKFEEIAVTNNKNQHGAILDVTLYSYFLSYEYAYKTIEGADGTTYFKKAIDDEIKRFEELEKSEGITSTSFRRLSTEYINSRDNFGYCRDMLVEYMIENEYIETI